MSGDDRAPTVAQVQEMIERALATPGAAMDCPCCGQRVQTYTRRPYSMQAFFLRDMVRLWVERGGLTRDDVWVHRREIKHAGNDYSYLALFRPLGEPDAPALIEAMRSEAGKARPGWWRPTPSALRWMRGEVKVPAYVLVYNGDVREVASEGVSFVEALGEPFDLDDVMGTAHAAARRA